MIDFEALLATLAEHQVAFSVVGGAAAIAHGSARFTQDLDIVYQRTPDNLWTGWSPPLGLQAILAGCSAGSAVSLGLPLSELSATHPLQARGGPAFRDLEALAELEAIEEEL